MGRNRANVRRSPLTLYWRAGKVTLRPLPPRRSQIEKPISFMPSIGPSLKCSSASASFPGGFPLSFGVILIVTGHSFWHFFLARFFALLAALVRRASRGLRGSRRVGMIKRDAGSARQARVRKTQGTRALARRAWGARGSG